MRPAVINLSTWPGRGERRATPPRRVRRHTERLWQRAGLVLVAAADQGAVPERWGLGVALSFVGPSTVKVLLIIDDALAVRDPEALERLCEWAAHRLVDGPQWHPVKVVTRSEFCDPDDGDLARAYRGVEWLITADEGRSLGLLADHWAPGHGRFAGGFSCGIHGWGQYGEWTDRTGRRHSGWRAQLHLPVLHLKTLGAHGTLAEFGRAGKGGRTLDGRPAGRWENGLPSRGRIVDLIGPAFTFDGLDTGDLGEHLGAFGLSSLDVPAAVPVSTESAEQLFDVVVAQHQLAMAIDEEAGQWFTTTHDRRLGRGVVGLRGTYSPGTIATHLYRTSGITPPFTKFERPDDTALDRWTAAVHGGWCTSAFPGAILPCVEIDVRSAYPAAFALLGCWNVLTAQELVEEDRTAELVELAARVATGDLAPLFDPSTYRRLGLVCAEVVPNGEPWPVSVVGRGGRSSLSVRGVRATVPLPFAWADVLLAAAESGRVPNVVSATRLVPAGCEKVRPIPLRDGVVVSPGKDPIVAVVRMRQVAKDRGDERLRRVLRLVANAAAWGIFCRLDQRRGPSNHGRRGRLIETPATWTWPPIAATVPAVVRLWLSVAERMVQHYGGIATARDTDGLVVVALPEGGSVRLPDGRAVYGLSWTEVDKVCAAFAPLDPFGDGRAFFEVDRG